MRRPDTLIVGHVTHDRYGDRVRAGGCAFYGGLVHRAFGSQVELATAIGADFSCDAELVQPGLELDLPATRTGETTLFRNTYLGGEQRRQTLEAVAPPIPPCGVSTESRDILHLAPVLHEVDLQAWVTRVPARWVAINVQGWTRATACGQGEPAVVGTRPWDVTPDELRGVHLACLSDEDLVGQGDLLARLRATVPVVVLTHGEHGCDVITVDQVFAVSACPATETDPTGAGDTFAAAFVHLLATGASPHAAASFASAAASIVVEAEGASAVDASFRQRVCERAALRHSESQGSSCRGPRAARCDPRYGPSGDRFEFAAEGASRGPIG